LLNRQITEEDVDREIQDILKRVIPEGTVVSEVALIQLREVFKEYLQMRMAMEDIIVAYSTMPLSILAICIDKGSKVILRRV